MSNVYLLIAEEMGLIGLGFFLPVMGVFFAYAWRARRRMERDSDLEPILLSLVGGLLGAMVAAWSMTVSSTWTFLIRCPFSGSTEP